MTGDLILWTDSYREVLSVEGLRYMDAFPFDIPPEEISSRSASYRQQIEEKERTPAEDDWLRLHKEYLERLKEE